jgi:hypothetical protein
VASPDPPPGVRFGYVTNPKAQSRFTLNLDKPAVAAIVDIVYQLSGGQTFVSRSLTDRPLREGSREITGSLGTVLGPVTSTTFRVWHVEYEDGTTDGQLEAQVAREELEPVRQAVKRYARRYAELARKSLLAVEEALALEPMPPDASTEDDIARGLIQANVAAYPDPLVLAERLERIAN